jgi:hypothetical protein
MAQTTVLYPLLYNVRYPLFPQGYPHFVLYNVLYKNTIGIKALIHSV